MNNLLDFIENARAGTLKESGPRTTVRERRRSLYRAYYHATGQTRKDQARQARYQAESRETAHRHGEAWDANDLATALRLQQPLMVSAQDAQRTYAAMRQGRYRLIRKAGFRNTLLKGEEQEFDALVRNEDATADDWIALDQKWREVFSRSVPHGPARALSPWTKWEVDLAKDPTLSDSQLARKLGRTPRAVSNKRTKMREGRPETFDRFWSESDLELLRDRGLSNREVAAITGRTASAVKQRRRRLESDRG